MKKLLILFSLLLLPACAQTEPHILSTEEGEQLIENTLLALEKYPEEEYRQYFHQFLFTSTNFEALLPAMVDGWNLKEPVNVRVSEIHRAFSETFDTDAINLIGTFRCKSLEHVSDFNFTFLKEKEENNSWKIVEFYFEECKTEI